MQIEQTLATDLKQIPAFVARVEREVCAVTSCADEAFKVKLALEEALSNAMRHGNASLPEALVLVRVMIDAAGVSIEVRDEGPGFDFTQVPDPNSATGMRKPSGRGIYLMRKLMDRVEFFDAGRGVRMTKSFPGV